MGNINFNTAMIYVSNQLYMKSYENYVFIYDWINVKFKKIIKSRIFEEHTRLVYLKQNSCHTH